MGLNERQKLLVNVHGHWRWSIMSGAREIFQVSSGQNTQSYRKCRWKWNEVEKKLWLIKRKAKSRSQLIQHRTASRSSSIVTASMENKRNSFEEKKRRFFIIIAPALEFDYEILFILASLQLNDGIFHSEFLLPFDNNKTSSWGDNEAGEGRWDVVNANKNYSRSWTINYAVWDEKAIESHSETGSWVSSDVNNVIKHSSNRVWLELSNFYLTWSDTHTLGRYAFDLVDRAARSGITDKFSSFSPFVGFAEKKNETFNIERRQWDRANQRNKKLYL